MTELLNKVPTKKRLFSIDALRGFDMFWILGGEKIFAAYDLIFPLFIFLSGVSLGIAAKPLTQYPPEKAKSIFIHGVKRLFMLLLLGIIYNHGWGVGIPADVESIRYASVLGRIGISWFVAALLVWFVSERVQWVIVISLLLGYWFLLSCVSLGGFGAGEYTAQGSINVWFDQHLLPGITYQNRLLDPEGILSNIASIVNALIGVFVGRFMIKYSTEAKKLISWLFLIGTTLIISGYIWGEVFPINKTLWTSSFVLVTSGYSILLLTVFYTLIDVLKISSWATFFAIIGTNSILIYLGSSVINWRYISHSFFGGLIDIASPGWAELILFGGMLLLQWYILYWLYCRKIFIKI